MLAIVAAIQPGFQRSKFDLICCGLFLLEMICRCINMVYMPEQTACQGWLGGKTWIKSAFIRWKDSIPLTKSSYVNLLQINFHHPSLLESCRWVCETVGMEVWLLIPIQNLFTHINAFYYRKEATTCPRIIFYQLLRNKMRRSHSI